MKRLSLLLLFVTILCILVGCGKDKAEEVGQEDSPLTESRETLASNQDTTVEVTTTVPEEKDYFSYCGTYINGGRLELTPNGNNAIDLFFSEVLDDGAYIETIEAQFLISDIVEDKVTVDIMDPWWNEGTLEICFRDNCTLQCRFDLTKRDYYAPCTFRTGTFIYSLYEEKDYFSYCGTYINGGRLELTPNGNNAIDLFFSEVLDDGAYIETIEAQFLISDIVDDKVTVDIMDPWWNEGTLEICFRDNCTLQCRFDLTKRDYYAPCTFRTGTFIYSLYEEGNPLDNETEVGCENNDTEGTTFGYSTFDRGEIRYKDILPALPVSMYQMTSDLYAQNVHVFTVDRQQIVFDVMEFLPIKAVTQIINNQDVIDIYCNGFFSHGNMTKEARFWMRYYYYPVGGWQCSTASRFAVLTYPEGQKVTPFEPIGKKLANFSYTDYPQGSPISMGEIADDILYAGLNVIRVEGVKRNFNIKSLNVIRANYYTDYMTNCQDFRVVVEIGFTDDMYDAIFRMALCYRDFAIGGWELVHDHYFSGVDAMERTEEYTVVPKTINYNESDFVAVAETYFTAFTEVSRKDSEQNGAPVREIAYLGEREHAYLKEYYNVILTAKFEETDWVETYTVDLVEADYSQLLGTWEYRDGEEYVRLHITDMRLDFQGDLGNGSYVKVGATISYTYETSAWGGTPYRTDVHDEELHVQAGNLVYKDQFYVDLDHHQDIILEIREYLNAEAFLHAVEMAIDVDKGVYATAVGDTFFSRSDPCYLTKIS